MYQFTTNTVINSQYALDYNGNQLKDSSGSAIELVSGSGAGLRVAKTGFFKKENIESIYKRPGVEAALAQYTVQLSGALTSGAQHRLTIELGMVPGAHSDFVNASLDFKKDIIVEVLGANNVNTDAAALNTALQSLKNNYGHSYITSSVVTNTLTLTVNEPELYFKSITLAKVEADTNSITQYKLTPITTVNTPTVVGTPGFGNYTWMTRNVTLQSLDNVSPFGISKNERPVIGGLYTQYVLRYRVPKVNDGIVGNGYSITTHVFWVLSSEVSRFDADLASVGATISTFIATASDGAGKTAQAPKYLDTTLNQTDQIVWTGAIGPVTFASDQVTRATVGTTGIVTTNSVSATGDVVITATDAVGNECKVYYTIYTTLTATASDTTGTTPATAKSLDTSDNATDQIAVGTSGAGTITYATNEPTVALVGATGLVTTNGVAGTGDVIITVSDSAGNIVYVYYNVIP